GRINFEVPNTRQNLVVIRMDNIKARVGDGNLAVDGDLKLAAKGQYGLYPVFANCHIQTNDVNLVSGDDRINFNSNLRLETIQNTNWLTGKLEVNEGEGSRKFALQNLTLLAESTQGS